MSHFRNYSHSYSHSDALSGPYKSGSASSVLAATTYGNGYNPLATPSNSTASVSWPTSNSVSPSIWSQDHQGSAQWPAYNQPYSLGVNYPATYNYGQQHYSADQGFHRRSLSRHQHSLSQPMVPMYQYTNQYSGNQQYVPAIPMVPVQSQVPVQNQSYMAQQRVPLFVPPQPVAQPIVPSIPAHLQAFTRAPVPHYQNIGYHDVSQSQTEYDLYTCAKFCVAVAAGLFAEQLTADETQTLERFLEMLLGATHLPKSTLLMSFVFLNQWNSLEAEIFQDTDFKTRIVLSLVLANKMNDDNTFTNASWGSVTKIEPARITALELAWLDAMEWKMNLDKAGIEEWNYWQACWNQYEQTIQTTNFLPSPASPNLGWPQGFLMEPFAMAAAC